MTAYGLIDTTEMYLRTLFELEEEGIPPLRARIVERLSQSGPTVSQTVARMGRDELVKVEDDRQLVLTPTGQALATRVMRMAMGLNKRDGARPRWPAPATGPA